MATGRAKKLWNQHGSKNTHWQHEKKFIQSQFRIPVFLRKTLDTVNFLQSDF